MLVERFDARFLFDVWSCRRGKGLHGAIDRAQRFLASFPRCVVWRADIARFFDNVDHVLLRSCLRRRITDPTAWFLLDQVIDSYPAPADLDRDRGRGIPIGNVTSQVFANIVLHELDRFVVHAIQPLRYLRYGDDFLLVAYDHRVAMGYRAHVTTFLYKALLFTVHDRNDIIIPSAKGLNFCGYDIFPTGRRLKRATEVRWRRLLCPGNIGSYHGLVSSQVLARKLRSFHWDVLRVGVVDTEQTESVWVM
jgi:hypothetical protein